ncbi:hypothetical protein WA026_020409 [Henosepilachna vigintioctopunctata]|uniref:Uncharacterized protein n=1 Tax=Henosepilachna vigintioctopunctata TaxID=420089 RepID=A0AAW1UM74_9CUCU
MSVIFATVNTGKAREDTIIYCVIPGGSAEPPPANSAGFMPSDILQACSRADHGSYLHNANVHLFFSAIRNREVIAVGSNFYQFEWGSKKDSQISPIVKYDTSLNYHIIHHFKS